MDQPSKPIDLIKACRRNEAWAWDELLDRHGRLIWSICQRSGLDSDEAEEIFQRTWVAVLEGLGRLKKPDRLASWIAGTTRNQIYRFFSESSRLRRETDIDGIEGSAEATVPAVAEIAIESSQRAAALADALEQMDPNCRSLLSLLFLEDPPLDYQEIADRTGLAIGSIGPKRARCLARLTRIFSRVYQNGNESDN